MSRDRELRSVSFVFFLFIIGFSDNDAFNFPRLDDDMNRSPQKHRMYDVTRKTGNGPFLDKLAVSSHNPRNSSSNDTTTADGLDQVSALLKEFSDLRAKKREQYDLYKTEKEHWHRSTTTPSLDIHEKYPKHDRRHKKKARKEKSKGFEKTRKQKHDKKKGSHYEAHPRHHLKEIPLETGSDSIRHRIPSNHKRDKYRPRSNKSIRKNYKDVSEFEDKNIHRSHKPDGSSLMNITQATPFVSSSQQGHDPPSEEEILESLRQMHTELIKEKILRLLRLDKPPKVPNAPLPEFPKAVKSSLLAQGDEPDSREMDHLNTPQAVIFAEEELLPCPGNSAKCVYFKMDQLERQEVLSAELWMYKEYDSNDSYNHTFVIYELEQASGNSTRPQLRQVVGALETSLKKGWVKFDLLNTVSFWVNKPHRNNGLQILCKTCKTGPGRFTPVSTSAEVRPVLVVKYGEPYRRFPRDDSNICHSKNNICCRQPLTIDFRSFKWDNWIVYPKSFETSYCRGTCERPHRIPTLLSTHSRLVMKTTAEHRPCCAPTEMKEISVLRRYKSQYIKENLAIKVTKCGCAT